LIDREFAHLRDVVFLNASLVVIPPESVQKAYFGFTENYIANYAEDLISRAWEMVGQARKEVATLLRAAPEEIAFVKNTTEGTGIIASGYPLKEGDNVIVPDQEHTANLYAWINLQHKGVELRVVESRENQVLIEDILDLVDDRTKIVAVSAVQYSTGYYIDLERLGTLCRERDILLVVDGIQAIGKLDIDVKKCNIGYLSCGGNKGLLSMLGAGLVYCDRSIVEKVIPPYACYQSVENYVKPPAMITDYTKINWHKDSRRFESGNLNYAGIAAIKAGTELINALGIKEIERHILSLEDMLLDGLQKMPFEFRTPLDRGCRSGLVCVYYPAELEDKINAIFKKYRIFATFRGGYIRMSLHLYNTEEDINITLKAFGEISDLISR
jgi:selenocysteine lyase/cysteine desulfurase